MIGKRDQWLIWGLSARESGFRAEKRGPRPGAGRFPMAGGGLPRWRRRVLLALDRVKKRKKAPKTLVQTKEKLPDVFKKTKKYCL